MNSIAADGSNAPDALLPLNRRNVLTGAGFTALVFPQLIAIIFVISIGSSSGGGSLGLLFGAYVYVFAAVGAAVVALIAVPVLGVPLSLAAGRILQGSTSTVVNLLGQFLAGALVSGVLLAIVAILNIDGLPIEGAALHVAIIVATGLAAALGWWLALIAYRRRQRTPDAQFEEPDAYAAS